ncbi:serine/threonine-protein kinase PknD [Chlamydia pecorum]|uniref:serine/threonine-protein kinase PknD n=1 Tax=Chlamydia pecorum TaxID=85991 RepID=UPI0007AF8DE7|nr:serine/threonine-protein kinase PknD [Chlamydia pecorum]
MQRYKIIRLIGKGGMGEVYLAYDTVCSRHVALKNIRKDLSNNTLLKQRFLREAKIAADLVHPGVVPVYTICSNQDPVYYTMPYIEGYTLKSLLKSVWKQEGLSKELAEKTSVGAFLSIFYKICATISYVHSRGVLHRDLKPDNILLGLFGEVVILDWGAAVSRVCLEPQCMSEQKLSLGESPQQMTVYGKLVGTPDYMAPERLLGNPASESTDVYALGVILYQMLTLSFPYHRARGKKILREPVLIAPPEDVAPYREIPPFLSSVVMKALAEDPSVRYSSVMELKEDIERYVQGNPKWIHKKNLDPQGRQSWKWCEPILLSKYFPMLEVLPSSWYRLAISNVESFSEVRLECTLSRRGVVEGFGVLLPPSVNSIDNSFYRGYGFWLQMKENVLSVSLVKNGLEIQKISQEIYGQKEAFSIILEKCSNSLSLYIDSALWLVYVDYMPSRGGHIGVLVQNMEEILGEIGVFESSGSLHVNCLAVPDAFLSEKLYDRALVFYKRIAESFPRRKEGCEALFRAGIALMEKASFEDDLDGFSCALEEFSLLHQSVLAPLEYLGKALVYQRLGEFHEEVKSLLLALKRYSQHPEISRLKDHLIYRLYESLHKRHSVTMVFLLLVLQVAPELISVGQEKTFLGYLKDKLQSSLLYRLGIAPPQLRSLKMELFLSLWSGFMPLLPELFQRAWELRDFRTLAEIFYVAAEIKYSEFLELYAEEFKRRVLSIELSQEAVEIAPEKMYVFIEDLQSILKGEEGLSRIEMLPPELILYLFELFANEAMICSQGERILEVLPMIRKHLPEAWEKLYLLPHEIRARLWMHEKQEAYDLINLYDPELRQDPCHEVFVLYGCWLALAKGQEHAEAHFQKGGNREFLLPCSLLARECISPGSIMGGLSFRERQLLLSQKFLYAHCLGLEKERDVCRASYERLFQERPL